MKWAFLVASVASATEVTPIQKVIQLLTDMQAKGKEEKHAEEVQFAAYKQFCENTTTDKERAIERNAEKIEVLGAAEKKASADSARLKREAAEASAEVDALQGDLKAMSNTRALEKKHFLKEQTDYQQSISACKRAVKTLKSQSHDRKQAKSDALLQLNDEIPASKRQLITSFLATDPADMSLAQMLQAPEANAYEFQSGGVVEMLEKLQHKFEDELSAMQKEETNRMHAYKMEQQQTSSRIENLTDQVERQTAQSAKLAQAAADAKGDKEDATQTKTEDEKFVKDLKATCTLKAADFKTRQQLRADEIEAIGKAVEIMSSDKVSGSGQKHLPQLTQTSFIQLKTEAFSREIVSDEVRERLAAFLNKKATDKHSRILMQVAQAATAGGPFDKIVGMIRQLVNRLQEEAAEEAEHNGWCETELGKNKKVREHKEDAVESLTADVEKLSASIAKAKEDLSILAEELTKLDGGMAEATDLRNKEKEQNTITIQEAKDAQVAVGQALTVLRDFYAKAGESTALLQQQPEAPEVFDEAYTGMQGMQGGVVGMLEVIESDFARVEADTKASEKQASDEYDQFMTDSKVDKAAKTTSQQNKEQKLQDEQQSLVQKEEDLRTTQNLLDAANSEFEKLKPTCIETGVSYEERVSKRKEEIESLQEALEMLAQQPM